VLLTWRISLASYSSYTLLNRNSAGSMHSLPCAVAGLAIQVQQLSSNTTESCFDS
jgi:hypothetical protein